MPPSPAGVPAPTTTLVSFENPNASGNLKVLSAQEPAHRILRGLFLVLIPCDITGERLCVAHRAKLTPFPCLSFCSHPLRFESRIFRLQVAHLQRCVCFYDELLALKRGFDNLRTLLLAPFPPSKNCWGCRDESTSTKDSQALPRVS